jgi:acyl-CoA thioesterase-1
VGDQDQGQAPLAPQPFQQEDDVVAGVLVQVAGGLVGQQHLGILDQGAGDRHALLLTAGQFRGQVAGPVGQADLL